MSSPLKCSSPTRIHALSVRIAGFQDGVVACANNRPDYYSDYIRYSTYEPLTNIGTLRSVKGALKAVNNVRFSNRPVRVKS
jgi:hypothetical protein